MLPNFNELLGKHPTWGIKIHVLQSTFAFLYSSKKLKTQENRPNQQNNPEKKKKKVIHLYIPRNTENKTEKRRADHRFW